MPTNTYEKFGCTVNSPAAVARVKDPLPVPSTCRFCGGIVCLVDNASFYGGRRYGWPLAYACSCCGARVGCHPDTDIPLGTLADKPTMAARTAAHAAFDPIWRNKGPGARRKAYEALCRVMGRTPAHISWMDIPDCQRVVALIRQGALGLAVRD